MCSFYFLIGWHWEPSERPTFKDIHLTLETMFQNSSITEGNLVLLSSFKIFRTFNVYSYFQLKII